MEKLPTSTGDRRISEPSTVPVPYLKRIFYRNVYDSNMGMGVRLLGGSLGISLDCTPTYSHSSFKMVVARRLSFLGWPMFKGKLLVLNGGSPFKF